MLLDSVRAFAPEGGLISDTYLNLVRRPTKLRGTRSAVGRLVRGRWMSPRGGAIMAEDCQAAGLAGSAARPAQRPGGSSGRRELESQGRGQR